MTITDVNDQLTLGSKEAVQERHGITQYRLKDSEKSKASTIQSLEYRIKGIETDKKRQ